VVAVVAFGGSAVVLTGSAVVRTGSAVVFGGSVVFGTSAVVGVVGFDVVPDPDVGEAVDVGLVVGLVVDLLGVVERRVVTDGFTGPVVPVTTEPAESSRNDDFRHSPDAVGASPNAPATW